MVIGHSNCVAREGGGNAQRASLWRWQLALFQIGLNGHFKRRIVGARQHQHMRIVRSECFLPSKPGIGAAHIP